MCTDVVLREKERDKYEDVNFERGSESHGKLAFDFVMAGRCAFF